MKRIIVFATIAVFVALAGVAHAQDRDEIMANVISRCLEDAKNYFAIEEHHQEPIAILIVTEDKDYYESVLKAISGTIKMHKDVFGGSSTLVYSQGVATCIRHNAMAIACVDDEKRVYRMGSTWGDKSCFCGEIGCFWKELN